MLFCRLSSDKCTEAMHLQTDKNLNNQTANKCQHFIIAMIFAVELLYKCFYYLLTYCFHQLSLLFFITFIVVY